ncbi:restriction endonuclease subunit S [Nocardia pseudovaccinii]|uniref:restriction endonuclease subunit S n=1 Tax=Nocardia pseudovaccinii TaxID=189540 RepID=UPI003D8D0369
MTAIAAKAEEIGEAGSRTFCGGGKSPDDARGAKLPQGWTLATIGELCHVNPRGFDEEPDDDDLISRVPMAAVEAESRRMDPSETIRYGEFKKKSLTRFQENDVLFAKITPCMENGKIVKATGLVGGRALGSTEFHVLRSRGGILPDYLVHYLLQRSVRIAAEPHMSGAVGQRRVSRPYLEGLQIPVPPLAEQHRIVYELDEQLAHVEAGEASTRTALLKSNQFIEQVFLLGTGGALDEVERFPAGISPADTDDGDLPNLPAGWSWKRLGEIAAVVGGITKDSKRQHDPEYVEVPYLRVANVQRGRLVLDRVETIRVPPTKAEALKLQQGDVLLNEGGDRDKLGRGWVWEGQIDNCIHQNHVFRARVLGDAISPLFLAWHANSFGKKWCDRNGKQTVNLASISLRKIRLLPVPVPPRSEQDRLVKVIESHVQEAAELQQAVRATLEQAVNLRAALLQAAFTGTLVPQDPADEVASALLARIKATRATGAGKKQRRAPDACNPTNIPDQEELPL